MASRFDGLVTVSYQVGACGDAAAYLMTLSPEAWQEWGDWSQQITARGGMPVPSRLSFDTADGLVPASVVRSYRTHGYDYDPSGEMPTEVMDYHSRNAGILCAMWPRRMLRDVGPGEVTIHAAHGTPAQLASLYPGTRVLAMHGDPLTMLRNFALKFAFVRDDGEAEIHVDAEILSLGGTPCRISRKAWLRSVLRSITAHNGAISRGHGCLPVSFHDLFGETGSHASYHAMVSHAGMTPDWPRAREFIMAYASAQPSRGSKLFSVDGGT